MTGNSLVIRIVRDGQPPAGFELLRGRLSATVDYAARDADCIRGLDIFSPGFHIRSRVR